MPEYYDNGSFSNSATPPPSGQDAGCALLFALLAIAAGLLLMGGGWLLRVWQLGGM